MTETSTNPDKDTQHLRRSFILAVSFAVLSWLILIVDIVFKFDLYQYGVYPLRMSGLHGIIWAPMIHGSISHVFANTAPIVILGTTLLYGYPKSAKIVLTATYIGSGILIWLFARDAYHIGSSGLNFGMMFFVFTIGVLRWDRRAIALSLLVFFLYGSMIWGIFPSAPGISFESHFSGALIGIVLAVLLKRHDTSPPEKHYSWEDESENPGPADGGSINERMPCGSVQPHPPAYARRSYSGMGSGLPLFLIILTFWISVTH